MDSADLALMRRIDVLNLEHPVMVARMLKEQPTRAGFAAGREHLNSLMLRKS
jgi:putative transposase